jgi:predicted esterase
MHIVRLINENAKKIVMIHGYGGGTATFMKMAPLL